MSESVSFLIFFVYIRLYIFLTRYELRKIEKDVDPITLMQLILEKEGRPYMVVTDSYDGDIITPDEKYIVHPSLLYETIPPPMQQASASSQSPTAEECEEEEYIPPTDQVYDYITPVQVRPDEEPIPELMVIKKIEGDIGIYVDSIKGDTFGPIMIPREDHYNLQMRMKEEQLAKTYVIVYSTTERKSRLLDIVIFNAMYCKWRETHNAPVKKRRR
jgi:hypothetical protein